MTSNMNFKDLLVKKGQLSIPFIGKFTLKYRSAYIDHVENKIYPPAKIIVFELDSSISINKVSTEEMEWSKLLQDACAENGQIIINDIGTLKKVNNIWVFTSLENNLGKDYQGLPKIEATPVFNENFVENKVENVKLSTESKDDTVIIEPVPSEIEEVAVVVSPSKAASENILAENDAGEADADIEQAQTSMEDRGRQKKSKELALGLVMGLSVFFMAIFLFNNYNKEGRSAQKLNVTNQRVNEKPSVEDAIWTDSEKVVNEVVNAKDVLTKDTQGSIDKEKESRSSEQFDTEMRGSTLNDASVKVEKPTNKNEENKSSFKNNLNGQNKEAIIIIGAFRNSNNLDNVTQKIKDMGFNLYTDRVRGLERIGLIYPYDNLNGLSKMIENASDQFNVQAWVLKK